MSMSSSPTLQFELKGALDFGAIESLHEFIKKIPPGGKYLEIGCGPSPLGLFLPSRKCLEITACDKSIKNVESMRRWLKNERALHSHTRRMLRLVGQLENACGGGGGQNYDEKRLQEIEERTRKSVKNLILGDILKDNITDELDNKCYDAIALQFVLLTACKSHADLEKAFVNLYNKLNAYGHLHVYGVYDCDSLTVGGRRYRYMKIDIEDVEEAARKAGFSKIVFNLDEAMKEFCLESIRPK